MLCELFSNFSVSLKLFQNRKLKTWRSVLNLLLLELNHKGKGRLLWWVLCLTHLISLSNCGTSSKPFLNTEKKCAFSLQSLRFMTSLNLFTTLSISEVLGFVYYFSTFILKRLCFLFKKCISIYPSNIPKTFMVTYHQG